MPPDCVDTHAHVFLRRLPMAPERRYTPTYDAPLARYLAVLDQHRVAAAVLVQPSFYGTDNRYLLHALKRGQGRLRGIAVADPSVDDATLATWGAAGVVGLRWNLIGVDPSRLSQPDERALLSRIAARGWQIEVQAEGPAWTQILTALADFDAPIVADHFGRPTPSLGVQCPGFQALLAAGRTRDLYIKASAPYRCGGASTAAYTEALLDRVGPERLLWGSDWPWTQHEGAHRYADTITPLATLTAGTARRLFCW